MNYSETARYLESFINYEKIPKWSYRKFLKLTRFKDFLNRIGNPQNTLKCIHVAGTKGKGSTCAFIAYILRQAGFKTGLYTSPHLSDFRERIRILSSRVDKRGRGITFEGMIPRKDLLRLVEKLKYNIERFNKKSKYGPLSFFEIYTALAFIYFKEQKVDFAVLETGLGGRLDATNTVRPLVCAITPISYEHTDKLGHTLTEIATEKTGIIKAQSSKRKNQNVTVIAAPQEEEAMAVIRARCKAKEAVLYEVGKDLSYIRTNRGLKVKGIFGNYSGIKIRLLGEHQLTNAAVAIGTIEALRNYGIKVSGDSIRRGLYSTFWPGRCEVISANPLVILDGAQNAASSRIIRKAIEDIFSYKKLILVLGISDDKDIKGICKELYDLADKVILTKADNLRASDPESLAQYFTDKD
ncbi:MAG: bifunctional folylpolyglutamate synthase/dihydrofolate synthase, partial [Deltaproteobacteria bacterium]